MRSFEGSAYGSLDAFRLVEREIPQPGPAQVRIRVEAAALGFVDGLLVQGRYQIRPPLPYVPGGEIAGTVDAVGAGVSHPKVGDRVVTWQLGGGLAEYVIAAADAVDAVPSPLEPGAAAAMLVDYPTAEYALFGRGAVRAGETVLVVGAAGGVGAAAVQLAAKSGAHVMAAASTPEKRELARELGARWCVDSSSAELRAEIKAHAPRGLDVVVDPVGGATFEPLFRSLAKEGRHLVIGFAGGSIPALPANLPLLKSASLIGVDIRHFFSAQPERARMDRLSLLERVASGALAPPRTTTFSLDDARSAIEATGRRDRLGKVVVRVGTA